LLTYNELKVIPSAYHIAFGLLLYIIPSKMSGIHRNNHLRY